MVFLEAKRKLFITFKRQIIKHLKAKIRSTQAS